MLLIEKLMQYIFFCHTFLAQSNLPTSKPPQHKHRGAPAGSWKSRLSASAQYTRQISIKLSATVEYKHSSGPAVTWHTPLDSWKLRGKELLANNGLQEIVGAKFPGNRQWLTLLFCWRILMWCIRYIQWYTVAFEKYLIGYTANQHFFYMIHVPRLGIRPWEKQTELVPTLHFTQRNSGYQILP